MDLARLAAESAYFQALSRSGMQEAVGGHLHLDHVPSGTFHAILQWVFLGRFSLAEEDLLPAVQAASYLLLPGFLDRCLVALRLLLSPQNCLSYLHSAEAVSCPELRAEVCGYLSAHLLELAASVTHRLAPQLREELALLRLQGPPQLCVLQKENVSRAQPPGASTAGLCPRRRGTGTVPPTCPSRPKSGASAQHSCSTTSSSWGATGRSGGLVDSSSAWQLSATIP